MLQQQRRQRQCTRRNFLHLTGHCYCSAYIVRGEGGCLAWQNRGNREGDNAGYNGNNLRKSKGFAPAVTSIQPQSQYQRRTAAKSPAGLQRKPPFFGVVGEKPSYFQKKSSSISLLKLFSFFFSAFHSGPGPNSGRKQGKASR